MRIYLLNEAIGSTKRGLSMELQELLATSKEFQADTCGPCHEDAACTHGCRGSVTATMPVRDDLSEYTNPEVVLRIEEKVGCSRKQAEDLFEEMKQYLFSTQARSGHKSPSKTVDTAWHEFILFTHDYAEFCHRYFGCFVHHVPTPRLTQ